jgi:hypothetical protein
MHFYILLTSLIAHCLADNYFDTPSGGFRPFGPGYTHGAYPQDFSIVGPPLEAIHDSQSPSTGLAVDVNHNLYLTYPRNAGPTPSNVVICTSFNDEKPWPNAAMQNCTTGQDPSTCFINVQNVVRDDKGRLWVVDNGIPAGAPASSDAVYGGAKLMSFNETTAQLISTYKIPKELLAYGMNMNDMKVNTTLGGREGYAFVTDASTNSSLLAIDLETGSGVRRLFNTSVVRADEKYVGSYDGELIYRWNGTSKGYLTTAADGITLGKDPIFRISSALIVSSIWKFLLGRPCFPPILLYLSRYSRKRQLNRCPSPGSSSESRPMRVGTGWLHVR